VKRAKFLIKSTFSTRLESEKTLFSFVWSQNYDSIYPPNFTPILATIFMINRSLTKLVLALTAGVFASVASVSMAAKPTLKEVTDATEAAAAKAPDQVTSIVEEKVKATPEYACPIIKAAAKGAKVAKQDETGLVTAALKAAPDKAPEIRACLAEGKTAGGKHPVSGKDVVGNTPVQPTQPGQTTNGVDSIDPNLDPTWNRFSGVVGTYVSTPSGSNGSGTNGNGGETTTVTTTTDTPTKVKTRTVFVPVTGS
jgi:hypothetical protein